jgi:hypothetical protein
VPFALVATVGGATANAYQDAAAVADILAGVPNAGAFDTATSSARDVAAVYATTLLEALAYLGVKATSDAGAQWPRGWVLDPDYGAADAAVSGYMTSGQWGAYLALDTIPKRIQRATRSLRSRFSARREGRVGRRVHAQRRAEGHRSAPDRLRLARLPALRPPRDPRRVARGLSAHARERARVGGARMSPISTLYADDHASALEDVSGAGAAITFTLTKTPQDDATGAPGVPVVTSVAGYAIGTAGDPKVYRDLNLTEAEAPTVFFVPTTLGARPALNAACVWGGVAHVVKSEKPFAPDGTAIASFVVIAR